jgi:hypothetical protein
MFSVVNKKSGQLQGCAGYENVFIEIPNDTFWCIDFYIGLYESISVPDGTILITSGKSTA